MSGHRMTSTKCLDVFMHRCMKLMEKKSNECDINKGKNTYKYTFKSIRDVGGKSFPFKNGLQFLKVSSTLGNVDSI